MPSRKIAHGVLLSSLLTLNAFASTPSPSLPFMKASDFTPFWKEGTGGEDVPAATVTPFRFKNQADRAVTESDLKGHVSLVNFFFTSCGFVCPRLMTQVQGVQKKLPSGSKIRIFSISVMPEDDLPAKLRAYAKARSINLRNWDLITGKRDEIYNLGRGVFRADRNPDGTLADSEFIHTQAVYLVDQSLRIRGVYQSDKSSDMALLVKDATRLAGGGP